MAKKFKTLPFDAAEHLDTEEAVVVFLDEALSSGDPSYVARALGVVARSRGMAAIAERSGLAREHLYRALSEKGNPELSTLMRVLQALGFRLAIAKSDAA